MKNILSVFVLIVCSISFDVSSIAYTQNIKTYKYKVEETFNHDASSYTQGLFFHEGVLYESAGQYGKSNFRQVDLKSGKILRQINFERKYFVEGSCSINGKFYILTWREHECFVYDSKTWKKIATFRYPNEGWGLTTDGKNLIMSDGTSKIRYYDPNTFALKKEIEVTSQGKKIVYLNELEYIKGEIWANVYTTDIIVRIDPSTGNVNSIVNCADILPIFQKRPSTDVLNGIAYDSANDKIYITGKNWPKIYRITVSDK